jgi:hypothetical protein
MSVNAEKVGKTAHLAGKYYPCLLDTHSPAPEAGHD